MAEIIGWISSLILVLTLAAQIKKQYTEKTSIGISKLLFSGQMLAELGFVIYSIAISSWIFVFTSSLLLLENIIGFYLTLKFKKQDPQKTIT